MDSDRNARRTSRAFQMLGTRRPGGLAGARLEGLESVEPPVDLSAGRIASSVEAARARFREIAKRAKTDKKVLAAAHARVLADAEAALVKLAADGEAAQVSDHEMAGLEAIVVPDGTRPALFVKDDDVDPTVAEAGTWGGQISALRTGISRVARSVGRINSAIGGPNYAGTGFVVAPGLIATNRHVLEVLAAGPGPPPGKPWKFLKPVAIDFAAELERPRKREFEVTGVAYAGPDPIRGQLHPEYLDLALLTVVANNGQEDLPAPLALSRRIKALRPGAEVFVMGYPARPNNEVGKVLMLVFQDEYFVKRFAPGYVLEDPDTFDDGGHKRVFTHDASTLGGNSGSCVVELEVQGNAVVGLHFGGLTRDENFAHSIARIEEVLDQHGAQLQDG
jgi:hypothetical protein